MSARILFTGLRRVKYALTFLIRALLLLLILPFAAAAMMDDSTEEKP